MVRPKFGIYGTPYDHLQIPNSSTAVPGTTPSISSESKSPSGNLLPSEINTNMGQLLYFMIYGYPPSSSANILKPRFAISESTQDLISKLLNTSKPLNNLEALSSHLTASHRESIPVEQSVVSGFTGKKKVGTRAGNLYDGAWVDGLRHGQGIYVWKAGHKYEGEWAAGKMHGKGRYELSDGGIYEGEFVKGKFHGKGI